MIKIISGLPDKIRKFRIESKLTQKQVADKLGVDRSTYSYYESGKISLDVKTVLSLSRIFDVDYTDIVDAEEISMFAADVARVSLQASEHKKCLDVPLTENLSVEEENILLSLRLLPADAYVEIMNIISEKLKVERRKHRRNFYKFPEQNKN